MSENPYQAPASEDIPRSLEGFQLPRFERTRIDVELLVDVHYAQYGSTGSLVIRALAFLVGPGSVFVATMVLLNSRRVGATGWLVIMAIIGLPGLLLIGWGIFGGVLNRHLLRMWLLFKQAAGEDVEYEFNRDGVIARGTRGVTELSWSSVWKWQDGNDVVLAWLDRKRFLILPVDRFSNETRELIEIVRISN